MGTLTLLVLSILSMKSVEAFEIRGSSSFGNSVGQW